MFLIVPPIKIINPAEISTMISTSIWVNLLRLSPFNNLFSKRESFGWHQSCHLIVRQRD